MKQCIAIFMMMVLVVGSVGTAFAAVPGDVAGTRYETAVADLAGKGVVSGYADGNFRPAATINRAEACILIARMLGATEADLASAPSSGFKDLEKFEWAEPFINYVASKGIVTGYGDGTIQPANDVSINEFVTMVVAAQGYKQESLTGTWPQSYLDKARELGILSTIPDTVLNAKESAERSEGSAAIQRGDVAVMIYNALTK